ncbi:MAG TPA: VOC family protein [Actinomycetota bacterium]|nr:VOC family protein [Actinomycetota bacterium]
MALLRFDHVLVTVDDLEAVTAFFVALGFEKEGTAAVEGDWVDTIVGLPDVRSEIVMLRPPGGGTGLELSKFHRPVPDRGPRAAPVNELGLRNVAFEVEDIHAVVDRLKAEGFELVGGIGNYEDVFLLCYVRGPEGIIVALNEHIG